MERVDFIYLCTAIGNLSGIPVRLFEGKEQIFYRDLTGLPRDPMILYREEIWAVSEHVGYFITPLFNYYGVVNAPPHKLVIGPTRQAPARDQELRELAFRLDIPRDETETFLAAMKNIVRMPLESVTQMLCTINFAVNREKFRLKDIAIIDAWQEEPQEQKTGNAPLRTVETAQKDVYTSYATEQALMNLVERGDTAALREWTASAPAIRPGVLSPDLVRQYKNIFIVSATLASRAAIRGGLAEEDAFLLSDAYIQKCELLSQPRQILALEYHMIFDYTQQVERLRSGGRGSRLALRAAGYIRQHLSETITVDALAKALYFSRSRFSARFKEETGQTITEFVLKEKTEEAKRLLRYSDKSATAIGDYLGFSSPGHFSRVFKQYAGRTPTEYREQYGKNGFG